MIVAYAGNGALDQAVLGRLRGAFRVEQVAGAAELEKIAGDCDVLVLGTGAGQELGEQIAQWPRGAFRRIATVIDQRVLDPDGAHDFAAALERCGVALVDAPIHCDNAQAFPELAATLCGGADDAVARVRPLLEAMGGKLIHFGGIGSGRTARLLVGAAAVCNRMATYECAAAGFSNGLSIADMALVLNRSSGANSASEYVLPHLVTDAQTTDMALAEVVGEMRLVSQLAMRAGAPLLMANLVGELCQALANGVGEGATFDDAVASMERAAGLRYEAR
jgi:3-hydroxyisobutyrate dehydrogenase